MRKLRHPAGVRRALGAWKILLAVLGLAAGLASASAEAHAIIVVAQPSINASVAQGELDIRLEFNTRIDRQRCRLALRRPDGGEAAVALVTDVPPNVLAARAHTDSSGRWRVEWQVLSLDGHITRGEVNFSVRDTSLAP
jgi:hypothetical protein